MTTSIKRSFFALIVALVGTSIGSYTVYAVYSYRIVNSQPAQHRFVSSLTETKQVSGIVKEFDTQKRVFMLEIADPYDHDASLMLSIHDTKATPKYLHPGIVGGLNPAPIADISIEPGMYATVSFSESPEFTANWVAILCRNNPCAI